MRPDPTLTAAAAVIAAVIGAAAFPADVLADSTSAKTAAVTHDGYTKHTQNIGSVSKMFGIVAAMQLNEQGKLDLDAPVTDYIPEFRMEDERYKQITVRMLMNYTSGMMGTTLENSFLYDDNDMSFHDNFIELLSHERLKDDPGEFSSYCNDGFTLLEHVIEHVSGESFTEYINKHICQPLGMNNTGTPVDMFRTDDHVRVMVNGTDYAPEYITTLAGGGILSDVTDLTSFGSAFFTGNETMLSESSKKEMLIPVAKDIYEAGGDGIGFGLGWDNAGYDKYKKAGVTVMSKGGATNHQYASLMIAPDEEICVSVLSSSGSSVLPTYLASSLLDAALAEKGIEVTNEGIADHSTEERVPDSYLKYEGFYSGGSFMQNDCVIYRISFPDSRYLLLEKVDGEIHSSEKYLYTGEDSFIRVLDDNGSFRIDNDKKLLTFTEKYGRIYVTSESEYKNISLDILSKSARYDMQKMTENKVDEKVQAAWDARQGSYYPVNLKYSNTTYNNVKVMKLRTYEELPGYSNMGKLTDSTHAEVYVSIPGGREFTDVEVREEDGKETLYLKEFGIEVISERDIPDLTADIHEIALENCSAKWYNIGEMGGRSVILDIPDNAAVYVYDMFDNVLYSSYMVNYGSKVILPQTGKIVFIGEDGGKIGIN